MTDTRSNRMLSGVRILELGQVIAGTFGGVILADLGAEVIKIEPPSGDTARNNKIAPIGDQSSIHLFMNRGKKSVVLDLKTEEGLEILYGLVARCDVVIDNFRPGVMARLGIDHETLKKHNSKIITASITGFGETGPLRDKPAFDLVVQAYSGHMDITGYPDGPPARVGVPLADMSGGIYCCISVLAALMGRELHGHDTHADVAMLDSMIHLLSYDALSNLTVGEKIVRHGSSHAHIVPWQAIPVSDGFVVIGVRDQKFFLNLCDAIGREDMKTDPRFIDNAARIVHRTELMPILEDAFLSKTQAEWVRILDEFDIPSAPVNSLDSLFADPQVEARGMKQTYQHPTVGEVTYQPSPMKISNWELSNVPAPMLGEHTEAILGELLGTSPEEVAELEALGALITWSG